MTPNKTLVTEWFKNFKKKEKKKKTRLYTNYLY